MITGSQLEDESYAKIKPKSNKSFQMTAKWISVSALLCIARI